MTDPTPTVTPELIEIYDNLILTNFDFILEKLTDILMIVIPLMFILISIRIAINIIRRVLYN